MGLLDPIISFPLSPSCWGEVLLHGDVDGPAVDRLIDVLRLYRRQFGEPLDPALTRGLMSEAEAVKETAKERFAAKCRPQPEPPPAPLPEPRELNKPKHEATSPSLDAIRARQERHDAECSRRGIKTRYDLYKVKAAEHLMKTGKPAIRSEIARACDIPSGSTTSVFADRNLFVEADGQKIRLVPDAMRTLRKLAPSNWPHDPQPSPKAPAMPPKRPLPDSDEELDTDLSLDLSGLTDEQRQAYAAAAKA